MFYHARVASISLFASAKNIAFTASVAKDLGVSRIISECRAGRMTVGSENTACIHVYLYTALHLYLFTLHFSLFPRWLPPGGSWRRQATEGECATLSLREHIVRRLLPPLTRSPSLPEGGSVILPHFAVCVNATLRPTPNPA